MLEFSTLFSILKLVYSRCWNIAWDWYPGCKESTWATHHPYETLDCLSLNMASASAWFLGLSRGSRRNQIDCTA